SSSAVRSTSSRCSGSSCRRSQAALSRSYMKRKNERGAGIAATLRAPAKTLEPQPDRRPGPLNCRGMTYFPAARAANPVSIRGEKRVEGVEEAVGCLGLGVVADPRKDDEASGRDGGGP